MKQKSQHQRPLVALFKRYWQAWWSIWVTFYHQSTRYLVAPACWWPLVATSISAWFTLRWCQPWNLISKIIFQIKKSNKTKESWGKHIHTEYLWRLIQRGPTSTSHGTRLSPHPPIPPHPPINQSQPNSHPGHINSKGFWEITIIFINLISWPGDLLVRVQPVE